MKMFSIFFCCSKDLFEPKRLKLPTRVGLCFGLPSWVWHSWYLGRRSLPTQPLQPKKTKNVQTWLVSSPKNVLGWWNMIIFFKWVICRFHLSSLEGILTIFFVSIHNFEDSKLNFYWGVSNRWKHQKPAYPCIVTTWGATTSVPADCSGLANAFGTGLVVFFLFCVALGKAEDWNMFWMQNACYVIWYAYV